MCFYLCGCHELLDDFVSIIAKVHRESMGKQDQYGFEFPTHLANLSNGNSWQRSWERSFKQLMEQMLQFARDAHGEDPEMVILRRVSLRRLFLGFCGH